MNRAGIAAVALLFVPATVHAQAYRCSPSAGGVARPHPELPSAAQPRRVVPIGGYTLALTWAPQYCRGRGGDASTRAECGAGNRFGFTLHGLWPDGEGRDWPQFCRATGIVPTAVVRAAICATPSAQLLQHEWAKHGTCMTQETPASYFRRSTELYARLRFPDMQALSRRTLNAGAFAGQLAAANAGLRADMVRVTTNRDGWLDEVWLCLDRSFRYTACVPGSGGVAPSQPLLIWRGAR